MGCALIRNRFEHNFAASNIRDSNERSNVGTFVQALAHSSSDDPVPPPELNDQLLAAVRLHGKWTSELG